MLPSCGHFKNIPCPFFKLALCVRPHCPYKHQTSENGQPRQLFSALADDTESLFDSKVNLSDILHKSSYNTSAIETQNPTYIPTPVDTNSRPPGILKSSNSNFERPSTSFVPEYKPTPISKLKEHCTSTINVKSVKSEYTPEYPVAIRKKKNVEEYDPTEVKCIPKKTVTFVDQTDLESEIPVILLSSDDELEDSENAPKFSDDDLEEETPAILNPIKQVPEVKTEKKDNIDVDEVKIDEYSVVDKILVDCKKNEILLKSYQKLKASPKTNDSPSKTTPVQKQDKNKPVLSQKFDVKNNKNHSHSFIKVEKNTVNVTCTNADDRISNVKSKPKREESSDTEPKVSKVKKSNVPKRESKSEKNETSKEKVHKSGSSHSSHSKEKQKKDSKESDKSKHLKKTSTENGKSTAVENKSSKSSSLSNRDSLDRKIPKKKTSETHNMKHTVNSSPDRKKVKSESSNLKGSESNIKCKEISSLNKYPTNIKRKSDDSDSEPHSSKNRSSSSVKKLKLDVQHDMKNIKSEYLKPEQKKQTNDQCSDLDVSDDVLNEYLSSSDSDPDEECRRIFNECYPEDSEPAKDDKTEVGSKPNASKNTELVILRKKRYAHPAAADLKKAPTKLSKADVKRPLPAAQVMYNRFAQCQAKFAQQNEIKDVAKGNSNKKRISFVPNQALLAAVNNKVNQNNSALSNFSPLPPTVSKTLKTVKRTAHIPDVAKKPRPIIPSGYGSKVPSNVRQKYLNAFIDECLKFSSSEDEAYNLALDEEKKVYERSSCKSLYLNVAANALKRLRRQAEDEPDTGSNSVSSKSISSKKTVSHETLLNGPLAQRRSFSIGRKKEAPEIKGGTALYEYLLTYVLTPEQLKENSYPLPHPTERDRAVIEGVYANRVAYCNDAFKRECCRCHKTYYVNVDGDYVRDEECDFHWGRIWKKRIAGSFESRYSCCQGDAESDGCCVSPGHVFEGSESHALKGFVKTLPKTPPPDNCYGIYALDCEMCYTTAGIELTRITVVDSDLKTVYESFVKPQHKVLDYNTRFSGITEDDLKNVRTSLHDVQAVLLCIFNDKSILIGHSLESDFKALKLFHNTVVDTSVVFPHKIGLPFKRALKTLMAEKLNKIIQNDVGGHDSQEDAVACMELMLFKIKEDVRSNR